MNYSPETSSSGQTMKTVSTEDEEFKLVSDLIVCPRAECSDDNWTGTQASWDWFFSLFAIRIVTWICWGDQTHQANEKKNFVMRLKEKNCGNKVELSTLREYNLTPSSCGSRLSLKRNVWVDVKSSKSGKSVRQIIITLC